MLIVENLRNGHTEGNKHLYFYYEMSLLKYLNVIKSKGFRIRFGFEFRLYLLTFNRILDDFIYSTNVY